MPYSDFDVTQLKTIEVEGLTIYVDNDEVGEKITKALTTAESRKWYSPPAEKVIMYGKQSVKSGKLKVIALDLENVEPNADSIIYFKPDGCHEIRISTINARSLQEKLINEFTHQLELGNPHLSSYSPTALEFKEKLRFALCQDYHIYAQKRDSLVPVQKEAGRLLFKLPRTYPVKEHTAEHLCFGLQAMAYSENACKSIAPNYTKVLSEYIDYEVQKPKPAFTTSNKLPQGNSILTSRLAAFREPKKLPEGSSSTTPNLPARQSGRSIVKKLPYTPKSAAPNSSVKVKVVHPDEILLPPKPAPRLKKPEPVITIKPLPGAKPPHASSTIKTVLPGVIKVGKGIFICLQLYNYKQEANEKYSYLQDENPALYQGVTSGVATTKVAAQSTFWMTLYAVNPFIAGGLTVLSFAASYTPDPKIKVDQAWAELTPDDFTEPTLDEQAYNNIWYGNPFGPCYGLKKEKLQELSSGVLALNPALKNQALRDIGVGVNYLTDKIDDGVDYCFEQALKGAGFNKPDPAEDYRAISELRALGNHPQTIQPGKREYKGDILTQTLSPAGNTESYNFATPQSEIKQYAKESFDPKKAPGEYENIEQNKSKNPADKMKYSWDFKWDAAGGLGTVTFDGLNAETMFALGFIGAFILVGASVIYWRKEKERFERRVEIIEDQCDFITEEMRKSFKIYKNAFKAMEKYQKAGSNEDKEKLLIKARNSFIKAAKFAEKMIKKYESLARDKHVKLHTTTLDAHFAIRDFLDKREGKRKARGPRLYHHSIHTPRKETKNFIEQEALPLLQEIQQSLKDILPVFINCYVLNLIGDYQANETILNQSKESYESGHISEAEFNIAVANHIDFIEQSNQVFHGFLQLLPENHEYRETVNTFIELNEAEIQHSFAYSHQVRLFNDCNLLANQYLAGLINEDDFAQKVEARVGVTDDEDKSFWNDFIQKNKSLNENNAHIADFNSGYKAYWDCKNQINEAVKQYKAGEISKEAFVQLIESLNAERVKLMGFIEQIEANPIQDKESELTVGFKQEFANDEIYYSNLLSNTLNEVYNEKRQQILNNYHDAVVKNEAHALAESYEELKGLKDPDERLDYMTRTHYLRERLLDEKRVVAMKIAHPDAVKMLEINKWLELFVARTLQADELKKAIGTAENENARDALTHALEESETLRNDAANKAAQQIHYEQNADSLRLLNLMSYAHLTTDVLFHLFSERIKETFALTDKQFQLINATIGTSLNMLSSSINDTLREFSIQDSYLISVGGLTAEQVSAFSAVRNAESSAGFLQASKSFLDKYNTPVLGIKLATVLGDLYLQSAYGASVKELADIDKPSYDDWLAENKYQGFFAQGNTIIRYAVDGFMLAQQLLSLGLLVSSKADSLTIIRKATTIFLSLSSVHQFIHYLMSHKNGEVSTNRLYIFYTLLVEHMNGNQLQQLFHLHEDTILTGIQEILQRNEFFKTAYFLESRWILNTLFVLRSLNAVQNSIADSNQRDVDFKIHNLKLKFLEIEAILQKAQTPEEKKQVARKAAAMYCDIKYALSFLNGDHEDLRKLYVTALFSQHLLNETIEIIPSVNKNTSLFKAVSSYTDESSELLCSMSSDYMATHLKGEPTDALIIEALSAILKRPIILIFNDFRLDLAKQNLMESGAICSGDPIFVFHDENNSMYHALHLREELYFEQRYQKKLAQESALPLELAKVKKVTPSTASIELKTKSKEAQGFLANLRAKRGAVSQTIPVQNSGSMQGKPAQYELTLFGKAALKEKAKEAQSFLASLRAEKGVPKR